MSKEEVATAASKLKPEVLELSEKILAGSELNKTDGVISETKGNYVENLPEGVTPEIDASISKYRANFVAASAHAVGTLAIGCLEKNKKLDVVSGEFKLSGGDVARHSVHRSKDYSFGSGADRKEITKVGVLQSEVDIKGGRTSGQLKVVRDTIAELGAEKLSGKK